MKKNKWDVVAKQGRAKQVLTKATTPATEQPDKLASVRIGQSFLRTAKANAARQGVTLQKYIEALISANDAK